MVSSKTLLKKVLLNLKYFEKKNIKENIVNLYEGMCISMYMDIIILKFCISNRPSRENALLKMYCIYLF